MHLNKNSGLNELVFVTCSSAVKCLSQQTHSAVLAENRAETSYCYTNSLCEVYFTAV